MSDEALARKSARAELATRVFVVFTIAALVVILGVGTSLLVKVSNVTDAIRTTQKTNTSVSHTNTELLQIIHSCLDPQGACYKLGQQQRATTAQGVQEAAAAAAACAHNLSEPTYRAVYECVQAALR